MAMNKIWKLTKLWGSLILGLTLVLVIFIYIMKMFPRAPAAPANCVFPECLVLSKLLLNIQDNSVKPCDDFFTHVCGNWLHSNMSNRTHSASTFTDMQYDNMAILRRLLDDELREEDNSIKKQVHTFYTSCMDTKTLNSLGSQPLYDVVQKVGGWPSSSHWTCNDFKETLQLLMSRFHTFPFFRAYLGFTPWDSTDKYIQIDHPEFEILLGFHHSDTREYVEEYQKYLKYLRIVGEILEANYTSHLIQDVFLLASKLHHVVTPLQERIRKRQLYRKTTVQELQTVAPAIDWLTCLQETFHRFSLNSSNQVIVHDMEYLVSMSHLVNQVQNRSVLQGYMVMALIETLSPYLDKRFLKARDQVQRTQDHTEVLPRWERCLYETNKYFEPVLSIMFMQETVSVENERLAMEILSDVKAMLHTIIGKLKWMDKDTQEKAQKQLQHVQIELGIPETYKINPMHTENEVTLENGQYLKNALQLQFVQEASAPWSIPPWSVYSHYSQRQNLLVFPAGILRPPIFHPHYPSAINFGGLGFIMAHELIHSLLEYVLPILWGDAEGNASEIHCLKDYYETFYVHNMTVNGSITLLENMADIGGLYIALQAYERFAQKHESEFVLPGVRLTSLELFYTSYGQLMCGFLSPEDLQLHLKTNPHSPPEVRVNGAVSSSHDFSRIFQCGEGAAMNSQLKCRVWL